MNDLQAAQEFYQGLLGLSVEKDSMGMLTLQTEGGTPTILYPKEDHQPATFTVLNFPVTDIRKTVKALRSKGVKMEQYADHRTDEDGIADNGGPAIAWFKDPAGNILSVIETT